MRRQQLVPRGDRVALRGEFAQPETADGLRQAGRLSARILVWNAMPSITPVMLPMRVELSGIAPIVPTTFETTSPPCAAIAEALAASRFASPASLAVRCTAWVSDSIELAVCCS